MFKRLRSILLMASASVILYTGSITGECHTLPESSFTQVEGTILKRSAGISDAAVVNDIQAYQKLPASIVNVLLANGVYIYEVEDLYLDTMPAAAPAKMTKNGIITDGSGRADGAAKPASYRRITKGGISTIQMTAPGYIDILSNLIVTETDTSSTLLHEVAHQLDFLYLGGYQATGTFYNASGQQEWQEVYAAEKNAVASYSKKAAVNVYTAYEAFAEATRIYFVNPEWLQKNCPLSYAYIDKIVSWF